MAIVSPGLILQDYTGSLRKAVIINADNSVNSPANPAKRGSVITIYGTGQGFIPNGPQDGNLPQSLITLPSPPRVAMNFLFLDEIAPQQGDPSGGFIQFAGLAPWAPGIWQINAYIPMSVVPGAQIPILVVMDGVASLDPNSYITVFSVSQ